MVVVVVGGGGGAVGELRLVLGRRFRLASASEAFPTDPFSFSFEEDVDNDARSPSEMHQICAVERFQKACRGTVEVLQKCR